jgi:O-antigen/teichoic acid export membrane protein
MFLTEEMPYSGAVTCQARSADLGSRVVRGGIWVFALRITNTLFGFARTIVLARLLAPADFGVFGIALLAMSALETFSQTGFSTALIQKKDETESYLDTAWTVQAVRGILLALVLYLTAGYVAAFFDASAAKPILQVIGLSMLFQGFTSIGVLYFQKDLEFHKQFIYMFSGTVADMSVTIAAAFLWRNPWALAIGLLAGSLMRMVVSYFVHPYRPRLGFDQQQFRELSGFGKWILGSSILFFFLTQADHALVGKVLGVSALGFYQLAYRLSNMPATEITQVISQVTFPAYSMLQDDLPRLRQAYLKVLQITAFLSFPIAGLIFVLAPDFTKVCLGERWMPMVPAMQALALAGLIRSLAATTGPVFLAVGKPRIDTICQIVRLIILAACIYPFVIRWDILGAGTAVVLSILISMGAFSFAIIKIAGCPLIQFSKVIIFPLLSCITMVVSMVVLKANIGVPIGPGLILVVTIVGCLGYLTTALLFDRFFNYGMRWVVRQQLGV